MQDDSSSHVVPHTGPSHPLNPEPSLPDERKAQGLEPKSYEDAAKEGLENSASNQNQTKPAKQTNGHGSNHKKSRSNSKKENISDSQKTNGVKSGIATLYGDGVLEKEFDSSDGGSLVSPKPPKEYKAALAQDELEKKPETPPESQLDIPDDLVSGRRVGQRWRQSRIRFAPLNVPLQRRLQTSVVLFHALSIAGGLALFFALCTIPLLWPILIPYLLYTLLSNASTSGQLSHRSEWMRRSPMWSLFASYYPARLHRSQPLPPTRKYIFGYHPHGIIAHGAFAAFATEALGFAQLFPGITNTLLTLDSNFRVPLYRDYALGMGLASVSRESCNNLLSRGGINGEGMGRAITIVVGGAREALDAKPGSLRLVLKRRKGFVKLAIRNGADLVPVIGIGENDLYDQMTRESNPRVHRAQLAIKKFLGFTTPLFHGRGIFNYDVGLMPYRRPLDVVVGRPIAVEQEDKPSDAYIDQVHHRYMKELERLWEVNRGRFGRGDEKLEIVE